MKSFERKNGAAGFTLIEMAIVLVVIGLIIGAVLKGQDLITNARMKKFVNFVRNAEISQWGYFDRNGAFAPNIPALGNMTDFHTNQIQAIGPATFSINLASFTDDKGKSFAGILVFPTSGTTPTALDQTKENDRTIYEYFKSFDAAVDGTAVGTTGRCRGVTEVTGVSATNRTVTLTSASTTPSGYNQAWTVNSLAGMIYWFDQIPN